MPVDATRWRRLAPVGDVPVLLSDSVTVFEPAAVGGAVLVTGSHGGTSALAYVIGLGARGVIVNDAGTGKDAAGVAGLRSAEEVGLAVVAVSHLSARIGDAIDTLAQGRVSHANGWARAAGVEQGMGASAAVEALARCQPAHLRASVEAPAPGEPALVHAGPPAIFAVDSAAQVDGSLVGTVVVTGSHGGATHGRALDVAVAGAAFNDAGIGKDRAGVARLSILEADGIPGLAVSHDSARIGEAFDAWVHGIVSVVNGPAADAGASIGQTVQSATLAIVAATGAGR